jgi:2-polyprenyl-3-methyl-5-hydroxy-6-metoxy-1,4-benzoquinol methylase
MKQWYEVLFENYAHKYEAEPFTKGTIGEVDFIEKEITFDKSLKILDIGCGTGRHAIELAKRGYDVVGVDLSASQLSRARDNAKHNQVRVRFLQADARTLAFQREFDVVIMICEGGFPLMETDEMNFSILQSAGRALKTNGTFLFTTLNGLYPLFHSVQDFINSQKEHDISRNNSFDLMTFRDYSDYTVVDDSGVEKQLRCNERYYVPSEITWLLKSIGFPIVDILGCQIGAWSRERKLSTDDFEMLVIASR